METIYGHSLTMCRRGESPLTYMPVISGELVLADPMAS